MTPYSPTNSTTFEFPHAFPVTTNIPGSPLDFDVFITATLFTPLHVVRELSSVRTSLADSVYLHQIFYLTHLNDVLITGSDEEKHEEDIKTMVKVLISFGF